MKFYDNFTQDIWLNIHNLWHYSLLKVNESEVRVSNLALGILLIFVGVKYSGYFASLIRKYVRVKLEADKDAANALEKVITYFCLCIYVVTVLEMINIPLNTFAFVGGALAIGIGFGAQTIIGNFINSLIIMVERPIKIGDIVEIEGVVGTVSSIGARCANLTTFSNMEVLVPNSKLMQNTLLNWTLNDKRIKYQVEVIVAKAQPQALDYLSLFSIFENIMRNLQSASHVPNPLVKLIDIKATFYVYLLSMDWNIGKDHNIYNVQNEINLALLKNLPGLAFEVKHMELMNLKSKDDSGSEPKPFSPI